MSLPSFAELEATLQAMRASTNIQPRKHLPSFVPEFKKVVHQDSQVSLPTGPRRLKKDNYSGLHFSPEEFVAEAVRLGHPTDHSSLFPKEVKHNVEYIKTKSIHQVAIERTEEIKRWVTLPLKILPKKRI